MKRTISMLLLLALALLVGDGGRLGAAATTAPIDPIVWTPFGCDPDVAGVPQTVCPDFFPVDRVVLITLRMSYGTGSSLVTFMRAFGVDDDGNVVYVLDTDNSAFSDLSTAYMHSLALEGGSAKSGGVLGDAKIPPQPDGGPGHDPPLATTVKDVKKAAKTAFAALNALE